MKQRCSENCPCSDADFKQPSLKEIDETYIKNLKGLVKLWKEDRTAFCMYQVNAGFQAPKIDPTTMTKEEVEEAFGIKIVES